MLWVFEPGRSSTLHLALPIAAMALTVGVAAPFARGLLASTPPDLGALRVLAVLLPGLFVWAVVTALHALEVHRFMVGDGTEHIIGAGLLTFGAALFSLFVFEIFGRQQAELKRRAQHLQHLHQASMSVAHEPVLTRLLDLITSGATSLTGADHALLSLARRDERGRTGPERADDRVGPLTVERVGGHRLDATLISRDMPLGSITVTRGQGPPFGIEETLQLEMFAVAAAAGIENVRRLEETQMLAMIEERERIARDLHDDLGQLLGFLTAKIQATQAFLTRGDAERASRELEGLERASRMLAAQVREAILGLRTRLGPGRPIATALEDYVIDLGVQANLTTSFDGDPDAGNTLPGPAQYQLLRIAQEALSNVRRHAQARSASVHLYAKDGNIVLEIADDGIGFDARPPRTGFGLKTMAERAASVGARFTLGSVPGRGTTVTVVVKAPT